MASVVSIAAIKWGALVMYFFSEWEQWHVLEKYERPSGFPPPHDIEKGLTDGMEFSGFYDMNRSEPIKVAMAQGLKINAELIVSRDTSLEPRMMIRQASTDIFFQIVGDPIEALNAATEQIKTYEIKEVQRPIDYRPRSDI